jgi:DNA-binding transcriptional LysR family regulator
MELRQLRYFVAVAEDLSFTEAAYRLGTSQPSLSQGIAKLEADLAVQLFYRGPRERPRLTPAGTMLLLEAHKILARVDETSRLIRGPISGAWPLRIGGVSSTIFGILPLAIKSMRERVPALDVLVYESDERDSVASLRAGTLDVALSRSTEQSAGILLVPLPDEPVYCALPDNHPLASREIVDVSELAAEAFVLFERDSAPHSYDVLTGMCMRAGFSMDIRMIVGNDLSLLGVVASGLAVSLVPSCTRRSRVPGVTFVPLADTAERLPLTIMMTTGAQTPAVEAFCAELREQYVAMLDAL